MQFIRSNTFQWTAGLAALFAIFVMAMFAFLYFKIDDYLIMRSDRMITAQAGFFAGLPRDRLINALDDHLGQDSRGVQFSGVFDASGKRIAGNVAAVPAEVKVGAAAESAHRITMKEARVTIAPRSPTLMVSARSMNSLMSSAMRWSGLSAASPSSCMR